MTVSEYSQDFLRWYDALKLLAQNSDASWLVSSDPKAHFAAYQNSLSPEEELAELDELAQWRGCGCGGGA